MKMNSMFDNESWNESGIEYDNESWIDFDW